MSLIVALQIVIALGIYNVWLLRFNKSTGFRGGSAKNMTEEFLAYGLPLWFMRVVMVLKLTFATMLLGGLVMPELVQPAAIGMTILMLGAVAMHAKVGDEIKKTLPAAAMLLMSILVATQSAIG